MPRVSFFYGIGIWMYFNEGVHNRPHFHARSLIPTVTVTDGWQTGIGSWRVPPPVVPG